MIPATSIALEKVRPGTGREAGLGHASDEDPSNQLLADAQSICDRWIPGWIFELRAALYSKRGFSNDITLAGEQLQHFVETKVAYGGALDWNGVKSHPDFAALRQTAEYAEIMRGR